jgi:tetratricopeptide (TPR) repeat protein
VPAAIAASLIGCLMVRQALEWARTDREAGALADRLARLHGVANPDPRALDGLANSEANLPDPSWTRATSAEIALRVAALARAGLDPVREERVAALLDAGRHVAPAQPAIRFALAWRSSQLGEGEGLGSRLGLSRDVATLAWSARQLLDADETGPALELYKEALVLAGMADLDHLDRPAPSDQQQVRRFQMPYESLASLVLRDLIDARRWGLDDWGPALTDFAPIPLAAARLLRERGNPDADRAIELAIEAASGPAPEGCDPAVHLAAGAEALALAGRWAEAEDQYRLALERLGDGDGSTEVWLARCWHFNLADLYARLGEPAREKEARRIALGNAPNDEITRLIMRAQHQAGIPLYDGATTPASFAPVPARSPIR